jgi:hypothetical protein
LELQSIDLFRSTARFFGAEGEKSALADELSALMMMRHHGVPTRLLDWTMSPFVAAAFACGVDIADRDDDRDGEIWSFDYDRYVLEGDKQWANCPESMEVVDGKRRFLAGRNAFVAEEPYNWFVCCFYPSGKFPRQDAQRGLYSMTARFGRRHDQAIAELLGDSRYFHRYVVPAAIKKELKEALRKRHGIWRGSLFPDVLGAADIARSIFSQ